ncbi:MULTISPECIES: lipopolysaccharide biosynthesis protein [Alphaproteobacteria]|uniref:Polysaccharide biosynthesis protein n=2 Tax=Alphaproteobacteria TaxID=28211 RepID=A0A512HNH2_9HYPH|nr:MULTISPECIES: oligosaccharide flippase family protein [Alphaproteobacteria]GEO86991.1 polysaccharide biosynthesis protein [Ciceribacter naphthalenivorans]GLR21633.1 polysaccharide biosynthesis protein [Ciceribacter naphthalenivorans]GLT04489.1 polysaccharide biosynthesis protein [Sphingomonas psychrolutea]
MPSTKDERRLAKVVTFFLNASRHSLVVNTFSYTINFGLQLVIQLGFFMLISRTLGAEGYGVFVTITSVSVIAVILIGVGSEYLLVHRVAVDPQLFPVYFGHALIMMAVTFPLVAIPTVVVLRQIVGDAIGLLPLVVIILTDLIFTRLNVLAAQAYMAFDRANKQLAINVMMMLSKLGFLAVAAFFGGLTVSTWAWWYFAAGALSASVAVAMVLRDLGRPVFTIVRKDLGLASLYCLEFLSVGSMKDLDKPVIMHTLGAEAGGQYAAGFRIVDAASAPVRAFLYATYTRHFRHAAGGRNSSLAFGVKLLPIAVGLALPVAAGLFIIADYIPRVLGADFNGTPEIVKALAFYPLLMGLSGIGADLLRALGHQRVRMALLIISSLALVPVVWIGIGYGGLVGAAYFRLILQTALTLLTWMTILLFKPQPRSDVSNR